MPKTFDLIVFDWDGTLMDSAAAIASAIRAAARDLGLEPPSDAQARHVIGLGLQDALAQALPQLEPHRYAEISERYRYHYLSQDRDLSLFTGITELLAELSGAGHMLAVATGKSRLGLNRALEASGVGGFFQGTRCADECFSKPHPQMLEELISEFGTRPAATLMIGDTIHDLQMARNAGVPALAVSYGAHPRQTLEAESPLLCADTVADLAAWLRTNG